MTSTYTTMLLSLLVLLLLHTCTGVLIGDEQYGKVEGGVFWTFHSQGVSLVDPLTCKIDHTFDKDAQGVPLPQKWSKGVYMQIVEPNSFGDDDVPLTDTPELLPKNDAYVLINSGDNSGEVIVMDTTTDHKAPVVGRINVGQKLGNAYAVHNRNQFWTHSDSDGYFYVVDLGTTVKDHTGHPIKVKMTTAHEGHLIWEIGIDDSTVTLGTSNVGYATSQGEQNLFIIDMLYHKQIDAYDFSKDAKNQTCPGAKSMAYSKLNQHLYMECAEIGGVLEYDVSHPESPLFIAQHQTIGGILLETPDQSYVTATDKAADAIHFFRPLATGELSTTPYKIRVEGHPELPTFYDHPDTFDYIACMPLTTNTNAHHINADDQVVCDYFNGCAPAETVEEVNNGMCLYADSSQTRLMSASLSQMDAVKNQEEPFGKLCGRCTNKANYHTTKEECICTPFCGSCASDDGYPQKADDPRLQSTGVMCVDVKDALLDVVQSADLVPAAGAVKRVGNYEEPGAPPCSMKEPTRAHKRGANYYDASISTVPNNELILVDMRVQGLQCRVELPGIPQQVIYVPTSYHYKSSGGGGFTTTMQIIVGVIAALVMLTIGMFACRGATKNRSNNNNTRTATDLELEIQAERAAKNGIELTNGNTNGEATKNNGNNNFTIGDDDDEVVSPPARIAQAEGSAANGASAVHSGHMT